MSELIDRQALIKQLKDENIPFNADINEIINIQPIAFDIDNIVEKLEEIKSKACDGIECMNCVYNKDCYEGEMSEVVAIDKAINIVNRKLTMEKTILDVCCGSRMFWFDKNNEKVVFMDKRILHDTLCDGRKLDIEPDIIGDFRNIPFDDNTFSMVVFDPPHLLKVGENSWLAKKYGKLSESWTTDIKQGFSECMRVLKPNGTLIFKWNEQQIKLSEILKTIDYKPLFGNKRSDTHWLVFMKEVEINNGLE